jgi:hypothetical protein
MSRKRNVPHPYCEIMIMRTFLQRLNQATWGFAWPIGAKVRVCTNRLPINIFLCPVAEQRA